MPVNIMNADISVMYMKCWCPGADLVPDVGTSQHCRISVSTSLGVTSCKSTGTFCTAVRAPIASPLQFPHSNIRWRSRYWLSPLGCPWSAFAPALFCGRLFIMQIEVLEKQVKLLRILVDGCKKHPAYRAIRPATGRCKPCVKMWKVRQELEASNK